MRRSHFKCMCVCVCVCVRARARACACVRTSVLSVTGYTSCDISIHRPLHVQLLCNNHNSSVAHTHPFSSAVGLL